MQISGEILPLKNIILNLIINISGHDEINYTYRLNKRLNNFHSSSSYSFFPLLFYTFSSMLHMHNSIYSTDTSIIFASWIESFSASSVTERWILVPRFSTRELTVSAVNTLLISELDSSRRIEWNYRSFSAKLSNVSRVWPTSRMKFMEEDARDEQFSIFLPLFLPI